MKHVASAFSEYSRLFELESQHLSAIPGSSTLGRTSCTNMPASRRTRSSPLSSLPRRPERQACREPRSPHRTPRGPPSRAFGAGHFPITPHQHLDQSRHRLAGGSAHRGDVLRGVLRGHTPPMQVGDVRIQPGRPVDVPSHQQHRRDDRAADHEPSLDHDQQSQVALGGRAEAFPHAD